MLLRPMAAQSGLRATMLRSTPLPRLTSSLLLPSTRFAPSRRLVGNFRTFSATTPPKPPQSDQATKDEHDPPAPLPGANGGISPAHREAAGLPSFVESWNPERFYTVGSVASVGVLATFAWCGPLSILPWACAVPVAGYWSAGLYDIRQQEHTIRRNFPVLGRVRYLLETFRPEIRQYFIGE
jgi:hypothetical protein